MADGVVLDASKPEAPAAEPEKKPTIPPGCIAVFCYFDPKTCNVGVQFDPDQIKGWPLAEMILHAACGIAKFNVDAGMGIAMQQRMAEQAHLQNIANKVAGGMRGRQMPQRPRH
jgi:hypothetical protein